MLKAMTQFVRIDIFNNSANIILRYQNKQNRKTSGKNKINFFANNCDIDIFTQSLSQRADCLLVQVYLTYFCIMQMRFLVFLVKSVANQQMSTISKNITTSLK